MLKWLPDFPANTTWRAVGQSSHPAGRPDMGGALATVGGQVRFWRVIGRDAEVGVANA